MNGSEFRDKENSRAPAGELDGKVHVWRAFLELAEESLHALERILSRDEKDRAARFRFERDRRRFIAAHGLLRKILGHYTGRDPSDVRFVRNRFGKPEVIPPPGARQVSFSLSHSHELALYAVAEETPVGIDVEYRYSPAVDPETGPRFFSRREAEELARLAPDERRQAFLRCWTRKEAYVKARGLGLSIPLDSFDVSLAPDEPARLIAVREDPAAAEDWRLFHLEPAPDYVGALAAARRCEMIFLGDWPL